MKRKSSVSVYSNRFHKCIETKRQSQKQYIKFLHIKILCN
jgi:hypothetical protein